ncbi:MAG: carbon monoxide dehydrogenase, partial [Candidatus Omnitrophica bacterium CG1_02_49_10]
MKFAFTGKGGVGKTTISALFAKALSKEGHRVLAIDADPDSNLGSALGFKEAGDITPIIKMKDMIHERMGIKDKDPTFYKLNPHIEDIPEKFMVTKDGVSLLVMGTVNEGGAGCVCPESAFLKSLLSYLLLRKDEDIVLDMEAGIEHLGRGILQSIDRLYIVVEPSRRSVETADRIYLLAKDIGIKNVAAIANKVRSKEDELFIRSSLRKEIEVAGVV